MHRLGIKFSKRYNTEERMHGYRIILNVRYKNDNKIAIKLIGII